MRNPPWPNLHVCTHTRYGQVKGAHMQAKALLLSLAKRTAVIHMPQVT